MRGCLSVSLAICKVSRWWAPDCKGEILIEPGPWPFKIPQRRRAEFGILQRPALGVDETIVTLAINYSDWGHCKVG